MSPSLRKSASSKALLGLILAQIVLILLSFDLKIFMGGDAHVDLLLAKSILSGNGFRDIWNPANPPDNWRQPGLPVISAALFAIFGEHHLVVKFFIALLSCGITVLLYFLFKDDLKQDIWYLLILFITNAAILEFSHYELTEIPYLFTIMLSLFLYQSKWKWGTVLVLIGAYYIRTDALVLWAGFMIFFSVTKNWRELIRFGLTFAAGILPWILRSLSIGGNQQLKVLLAKNEYLPDLGRIGLDDLVTRIGANFKYYFLAKGGSVVLNVTGFVTVIVMLVALIGLGRFYRAGRVGKIIFWFVLGHIILFLFWQSSAQYYRYYIAIAPFLMVGLVLGFNWCCKLARRAF